MIILLVMCAGILAGRFLVPGRVKRLNERIELACTLILIFSMGVMLGQKENFLEELGRLGFSSFLFFLLPTALSIVFVYLLSRRFLEKKRKTEEKEEREW